jgi:integrase/recombinase XerD
LICVDLWTHLYIRAVKRLAAFLGRSPDAATAEDLRSLQLHLTETGVRPPAINATVTALRFFFKATLDRPETTRPLAFVYEPRKLPRALARGGVAPPGGGARAQAQGGAQRCLRRWSASHGGRRAEGLRHRFQAHDDPGGAGRKPAPAQAGGRKDRFAMLAPQLLELLELLRDWWRIARPEVWIVPERPIPHPQRRTRSSLVIDRRRQGSAGPALGIAFPAALIPDRHRHGC